ncbi:hypothetical protein [Desulfolutivibrio sp.]|uniref:hypothetical protein n=1 Tax=Desulfolutivibrio sp. TaxID=2773296 RepID=UPI002F962E25
MTMTFQVVGEEIANPEVRRFFQELGVDLDDYRPLPTTTPQELMAGGKPMKQ